MQTVRDMHMQQKNARYIDTFSMIQTIIMICTACVQVFVIQKFFTANPNKIRI